ncbi:hypothetical protein CgunFtcFv8_015735 [Champsocephalus gunnari]|uniref:Uncharacterized protein n=1 Tax=Champsocephalus gunnari TaxID=52237 RepID=A0AAN8C765_CHAGU|nr:hypothetical protein CgunFtcFv8_015735 [Champsocephalus gunnari]
MYLRMQLRTPQASGARAPAWLPVTAHNQQKQTSLSPIYGSRVSLQPQISLSPSSGSSRIKSPARSISPGQQPQQLQPTLQLSPPRGRSEDAGGAAGGKGKKSQVPLEPVHLKGPPFPRLTRVSPSPGAPVISH